MKNFDHRYALALLLCCATHAFAQLTVVNLGGANANAQKKAYYEPFEKANNIKITSVEYNDEQAKIKAMVEARKVTWDVVEVEAIDLERGCDEGLFETLDWSKLSPKADFPSWATHPCGVGLFIWSKVMAYNADRIKEGPKSWADFWDINKFPGKRGMRKTPRQNLEIALMADGVKAPDVYKTLATKKGVERAFRKLTELKPHIVWWETGAQPPQLLIAGDVVLSTAYNGRIDAAQREGRNLKISWHGNSFNVDYWVIPKGAPTKELGHKFIAFATSPEAQAEYSKLISYGPSNTKALAKLDDNLLSNLPTAPANAKDALRVNARFWIDQGEALEKRFATWAAQ